MDYSRAPCLGADQKARGLWKQDCCVTIASTRSLENNAIPKMADKLIVVTVLLAFSSFGTIFSDKVSDLQGKEL